MRLFTFLAILKYVDLAPPCPNDQYWKKWVEFSYFMSHSHNIELGVRGAFMRLSQ
jgi:cytosine/uracil/thiamine/allantoin permease